MGQENSNTKLSQNIIVFGVNLLLDEKLMGSEWQKDQINWCQDFTLYKNSSEKPNQLLWCPKQCEIQSNNIMIELYYSKQLNLQYQIQNSRAFYMFLSTLKIKLFQINTEN